MRKNDTGVFQLDNGYWGYRYAIRIDGKSRESKKVKDEFGNPFKTKSSAVKARQQAIMNEKINAAAPQLKRPRKKVSKVYDEYCEFGRAGKAYATIVKQDSLWNNHIKSKFGKRYVDDISVAEINDYLAELYYTENRAYSYTESFLKIFYLIFGQAYSRNYLNAEQYDKLCKNKDTKIHMPKMKIDEDTDIVTFSDEQMITLSEYFKDTNAETAFMLGKYCGLRINECYGLKWCNVDFDNDIIKIDRQIQYQNGVIKLVSLKTRNARRDIVMSTPLREYLLSVKRHRDKIMVELTEQR
jgi:integrase